MAGVCKTLGAYKKRAKSPMICGTTRKDSLRTVRTTSPSEIPGSLNATSMRNCCCLYTSDSPVSKENLSPALRGKQSRTKAEGSGIVPPCIR